MEHAEAGAGAMLVACRLAGLSALVKVYDLVQSLIFYPLVEDDRYFVSVRELDTKSLARSKQLTKHISIAGPRNSLTGPVTNSSQAKTSTTEDVLTKSHSAM
jgi:hypothetical protein